MEARSPSPSGILIISDDHEFARILAARWQVGNNRLALTLAGSNVWNGANAAGYELIVVGPVRKGKLTPILNSFESVTATAVCVTEAASAVRALETTYPRLLVIPQRDGWLDSLLQICGEVLRRTEALSRARRAEHAAVSSERFAALGRYMLEMRHSVNNALTSVLGNADLLLSEQDQLSGRSREQIETIHSMSLRLSEIMQRFSSLASEMAVAEKQSQSETDSVTGSLVPGS
jgi:signal transduction histidine kinase